jgi:hypothetical protein
MVICYNIVNSIATVLCILANLSRTIKNERLGSIGPLHLLHKYRGPRSVPLMLCFMPLSRL